MNAPKSDRATSVAPLHACDLSLTPVEVARGLAHLPGLVFLDSAAADHEAFRRDARFSLVAALPRALVSGDYFVESDRERLRSAMRECGTESLPSLDRGFPAGGAIGAIDYDGSFRFGIYPEVLIYDHRHDSWLETGDLARRVRRRSVRLRRPAPELATASFERSQDREAFCDGVRRAQEYIAAGDIYQVNLSHQFRTAFPGDAEAGLDLYEKLRDASPAPFAVYLDQGNGRRVLSSSPELFMEMSGSAIRTRPIKGTRPRFRDSARDEKSAYDLLTSPKEIAELIMITDLERNDLGQICEFGSVRATDLLKLERYAQVFHLVSTVEGTLRPEIDHLEALFACFPGGSITGAPKKRAREIIEELEPEPRGLYTGTIGMFGFNGESRFNIAIRTAIIEEGELHFHVGAGIVADSVPEAEYEETLHKAAGILRACGATVPE